MRVLRKIRSRNIRTTSVSNILNEKNEINIIQTIAPTFQNKLVIPSFGTRFYGSTKINYDQLDTKQQTTDGIHDDVDIDIEIEEGETDDESIQPWKGLLEAPARASWRVTDDQFPIDIARAYDKILTEGERTPKQLKRAHQKVLSIHAELEAYRERERRRLVNGRQPSGDGDSIKPVYYGYDETLATLRHRMLPNYAVTTRVLEECQSLLGHKSWSPKRIIDFGIGCGSASAAALNIFPDIEWIHGIEPSQTMRECSERLIEGMTKEEVSSSPRMTYSRTLSADGGAVGGSFDLALCAYTATDLPDIMSTLAAAAIMIEKLKPNGVLVVIEPGTPDGFNSIRSIRNMLLDCCPPDDPDFEWEERCHVIAPCTHNGICPMERHKKDYVQRGKLAYDLPQDLDSVRLEDSKLMRDGLKIDENLDEDFIDLTLQHDHVSETDRFDSAFCSFVQTLPGQDSRKKGEKFSYLVVQKRIFGREEENNDCFKGDNLTDLLSQAHQAAAHNDMEMAQSIFAKAQDLESRYFDSDEDNLGLELLRGQEKRESMGRIVHAPIKKKGHIYIDYCAGPGRIVRSRIAKSTSNVAPGIYTAARKSRWGGLWPDLMENQDLNGE